MQGIKCDFCKRNAAYDGKTKSGHWANMCEKHFIVHGIGIGLGRGQLLECLEGGELNVGNNRRFKGISSQK
jgi:hypothetical protein